MAYDVQNSANEHAQQLKEKAGYEVMRAAQNVQQGYIGGPSGAALGLAGTTAMRDPRVAMIAAAERLEKRAKHLRSLAEELPSDPRRLLRDALDALDYVDV